MPYNPLRLQYLFGKYLGNSCTPAELQEFWELMGEMPEDDAVAAEIWQLWEQEPAQAGALNVNTYQRIQQQVAGWERQKDAQERSRIWNRVHWWKYAAAAVFVFCIAGAAYLALKERGTKQAGLPARLADAHIAPGGNKAMLTLANGKVIALDEAANGTLAIEGSASIEKLSDGQISYHTGSPAGNVSFNTIATPRGGLFSVVLPDGTRAWLNAASSLRYPTAFPGPDRRVELKGEGYFEVASNAVQPFYVMVNGMAVKVLGTHFNVSAYDEDDSTHTALLEGAVEVSKAGSKQLLRTGQQAIVENTGSAITVRDVDMDAVVAWKEGRFAFDGNLPSIMRQIARWYDVTVEFRGEVVSKSFAATLPRYSHLSEVLTMLEYTKSVRFSIEGRKLIVKPYSD